jgi:RND family efflux transporter MFP subunit
MARGRLHHQEEDPKVPARRRVESITICALLLACERAAPGAPQAAPAVMRAHPREDALAGITLTPEAEQRLGIALAPVEQRVMPGARRLPGEVVAPPGRTLTISAPVAGLVLAAEGLPRPGATVERGQALARLIPLAAVDRDLRAQAQSRVAAAEARLLAHRSRVQRTESLIPSGAGSERAAEDARVERDVAAAELVAAQARLRIIERAPLSSDVVTTLRAPFTATVRQTQVADGQAVSGGAPLIELVADEAPWVRVPVLAAELALLAEGPAEVAPLGAPPGATMRAGPAAGPPTADAAAGTVDLYFELPGRGALRLGERVTVTLATRATPPALVVPWSAIVHDTGGGAWVYVQVGAQQYQRRRVELERVAGELAVLTRGPEVGAQVVVRGAVELYGTEFGAGH